MSLVAERGDVEVVDGVQKNLIGCNWKLAVDNLYDWYHPPVSHRSASRSGFYPMVENEDALYQPMNQMVMLGEYGHGIGGPMITEEQMALAQQPGGAPGVEPWRTRPEARATFGPHGVRSKGHPNVFPNLWVALGGTQLCLRIPRGPQQTEFWWFTFVEKGLPEEQRRQRVQMATHFFGPAGLFEQDDGENWDQCTRGTTGPVSRRYPLHFTMGRGLDEVKEDGGQQRVETVVNEHGQRWTYQAWAEWMDATDWADLRANHSLPPSGVV